MGKKLGRPTKYKEEYIEQAHKFCLLGATNEKLAFLFEVDVTTIELWLKTKPLFSGAIKEGRAIADSKVAQSLYHRALGYSHKEDKIFNHNGKTTVVETIKHYPPDTAAAFIWLKNRAGWRDKATVEHTGSISFTGMMNELYGKTINGEFKEIESE